MSSWLDAIKTYFEIRNRSWVNLDTREFLHQVCPSKDVLWYKYVRHLIERKHRALQQQGKRLLRVHSTMRVHDAVEHDAGKRVDSQIHVHVDETIYWVYQDKDKFSVESRVIVHKQVWSARRGNWQLTADEETNEKDIYVKGARAHANHVIVPSDQASGLSDAPPRLSGFARGINQYDRVKAIRYAELWWNGYNSMYPVLDDDCTSFISQCLHAGRLGMSKPTSRSTGWWYRFGGFEGAQEAQEAGSSDLRGSNGSQGPGGEPWSYSWAVSEMLYQYLMRTVGATRVSTARELKMGDIVFYDWDGSGRYHHTTIVTDFDEYGDPLVNAHSDSSLHRPYTYFDSRAWTRRTRYAFVHLPDTFGITKRDEETDDMHQVLRA